VEVDLEEGGRSNHGGVGLVMEVGLAMEVGQICKYTNKQSILIAVYIQCT